MSDPGETTEPEEPDTGVNNNGNGNDNGNDGNHSGWYKDGSAPAEEETLEASLVLAATSGGNGNNGNQGNGNGNKDKPTGSDVMNTSTVVKQFVVDFSREDYKPLMEQEVNGLTYRYVNSDKARLSVVVQGIENGSSSLLDSRGELHAYYHTDYLGTTDYLTSAVNSKVIAWTSYNEWGEITHNAVLKCGQRELDLVKEYATHDYDAVLDLYYAKARFYDAYNRTDPILDPSQYDLREYVKEPMALVQYLYVRANATNKIDPLGEAWFDAQGNWHYDNWEFVPDSNYERPANPRNSTLMEGHSGYAVQQMQIQLRDKGYLSNSECDGIFGPKTRDAVEKFQQDHGLSADGIVGPKTWAAFFSSGTSSISKGGKNPATDNKIQTPNTTVDNKQYTGPRIDHWQEILYDRVSARLDEIQPNIGDEQASAQLQEIIYEEADKLRPEFSLIYDTYKIYNRNNPDFKKIVDLFESPVLNDPNAHTGLPLFDGDRFQAEFTMGVLMEAINWGYFSQNTCTPTTQKAEPKIETKDGYVAPKGGGGVTATIKVGDYQVDFGHGGRHLEGSGLSVGRVNQAIANDVVRHPPALSKMYKGSVVVDGVKIIYTSYGKASGIINIGTYYIE